MSDLVPALDIAVLGACSRAGVAVQGADGPLYPVWAERVWGLVSGRLEEAALRLAADERHREAMLAVAALYEKRNPSFRPRISFEVHPHVDAYVESATAVAEETA